MSDKPVEKEASQPKKTIPETTLPKDEMTRAERIFVRISVLQTFLAIAGMFTGAIALYAALNEADAVRKQQQAAVWPSIGVTQINYGSPGEERFVINVSNKGIGPARIITAEVTIDGEPVSSWREVLRQFSDGQPFAMSNFRIGGSVLAPGEEVTAVAVEQKYSSKEILSGFRELASSGRANLSICYCSVFDDCWRFDAVKESTEPIEQCPAPNPSSSI